MSHRFQINLRGIIDLLSNHLYSKPEVFLRELLQNAVDAITARQSLTPELAGEIRLTVTSPEGRPPILEINENGIGLTEDEVHRFLATIGESSKRGPDGLKTGDFLGQFGIGLLSCFVVSDEIVVVTRSARDGHAGVEWRGQADGTYSLRTLTAPIEPGTTVYLTCRKGQEQFFERERVAELARHYGLLLPYAIHVTDGTTSEQVNEGGAPWRSTGRQAAPGSVQLLKFGEEAFGTRFLDAIPLKSKAGKVDGVAFVLPSPANLGSRRSSRVYLRNMLLSESAENLLPDWAFFVKAVVNANDLRPTASREDFYEDESLEAARVELGNCLRDWLVNLAESDPMRFNRFLSIHHLALKALALQDDDCYARFINLLPFETSQGRMTIGELRDRGEPIRFVSDIAQFQQLESIASAQGLLLVNAGYVYETDLLSRLPDIDEDIQLMSIDADSFAQELGELSATELAEMDYLLSVASSVLKEFGCEPDLRKFEPVELPAMLAVDRETQFFRALDKSRELANDLFGDVLNSLEKARNSRPQSHLILNSRNSLIRRLGQIRSEAILKRSIEVLYVQGLLLAHQPLSSRELQVLSGGLGGLLDLLIAHPEGFRDA